MLASKAIEAFLLSYHGSKSPQTIIWYERRLSALLLFLGDVEVATITISDLRRWRAGLFERRTRYENHPSGRRPEPGGLSAHTLHGYVRAARRFFRWLEEEELLDHNPARRLELPKLPRRMVRGIAQGDLSKILEAARQSGPRDHALVWFFYSTACRVGGVVNLRLDDLDLGRCRARVREKGDKTRPVFLIPPAADAMRAWLDVRPDSDDDDHVFLGERGPLKGSGVYQVMKRLAKRAGVARGWNPHNWRHRRIRDLQARGMPLGVLSQYAGHASVEVTADIYGTLPEDELQQLYFQYALSEGRNIPYSVP